MKNNVSIIWIPFQWYSNMFIPGIQRVDPCGLLTMWKITHCLIGWWFGTSFFFHPVGNVIIPTDELIFFRGVGQPPTSWCFPVISRCELRTPSASVPPSPPSAALRPWAALRPSPAGAGPCSSLGRRSRRRTWRWIRPSPRVTGERWLVKHLKPQKNEDGNDVNDGFKQRHWWVTSSSHLLQWRYLFMGRTKVGIWGFQPPKQSLISDFNKQTLGSSAISARNWFTAVKFWSGAFTRRIDFLAFFIPFGADGFYHVFSNLLSLVQSENPSCATMMGSLCVFFDTFTSPPVRSSDETP